MNCYQEYTVISGDFINPIEIFNLFYNADKTNVFFLESVVENAYIGRYSFIGIGAEEEIIGYNEKVVIRRGTQKEEVNCTNVMDFIKEHIASFSYEKQEGLPTFSAGFVGYFSYEIIGQIENVDFNETDFPQFHFVLPKVLIAYDNIYQKIYLISNSLDIGFQHNAAIDDIEKKLFAPIARLQPLRSKSDVPEPASDFTKTEFESAVSKAKDYIYAGDIFQVVLSQNFSLPVSENKIDIYRRLRGLNPSPYMFFIRFDEVTLIGSSPEILVKKVGDKVTLRPIAGTRPRGKDEAQDKANEESLLNDEKELAEHTMLIDLARNDLGRVCEKGSVALSEYKKIERYSHVMHIVSEVSGKIKQDKDAIDLFAASFPAGTVSGAPKIRAMEIINELEKTARGPYAGTVGYIDFSGNMDFCITIRTIIINGNTANIRAGAGIVFDSVPENEYIETLNKAKALMQIV